MQRQQEGKDVNDTGQSGKNKNGTYCGTIAEKSSGDIACAGTGDYRITYYQAVHRCQKKAGAFF